MDNHLNPSSFIMMPIPATTYTAVCALLGGALVMAPRADQGNVVAGDTNVDRRVAVKESANVAEVSQAVATTGGVNAPADNAEIDAHGYPWNEDMHASTKGKTKDGLWRMKVGITRPDPLPGFPRDNAEQSKATGTSSETSTNSAILPTATEAVNDPIDTSTDDDEFAAFREAAEASNAADQAAAASVPARQLSDADLGALCNQAAVKLGDPSPVKEIIARFVPEGQVAHSRNIPEDRREEFAAAVEAKAGIQFAG